MAFSVRIEALRFPLDTPVLMLEPGWWNAGELMNDDRFQYSNDTGSYADYTATLSLQEFRDMHEHYKLPAGHSALEDSRTRAAMTMMDALPDLLTDQDDKVIVTVFEWDTGY